MVLHVCSFLGVLLAIDAPSSYAAQFILLHTAVFRFPAKDDGDVRLVVGDEMLLKLDQTSARQYGRPWEGNGNILWVEDSELGLEMKTSNVPADITEGYISEFVWKSVSYDRMQHGKFEVLCRAKDTHCP